MSKCIFCRIVSGVVPCHTIAESKDYIAFLDRAPLTEGHTIVVPKIHCETIWDTSEIGMYYQFVQDVGNHFRSKGFTYVDTMTLGRMVPHAHVHILPHNGDGSDWNTILEKIGELQCDSDRFLSPQKAGILSRRFGCMT